MKIYNYDKNTQEYLSIEDALESPLEKGVYMIPANATTIIPPKVKTNQVAIFQKKEWIIKSDYRSSTIYNTKTQESKEVDYIGDIEEGWTLLEPLENSKWNGKAWILDLVQVLEKKQREVSIQKSKFIAQGVILEDISFYSDKEAFLLIKNAGIDMLQIGQTVAIWKGINGVLHNPTLEQMQTLFMLVAQKLQKSFVIEATLNDRISKLKVNELNAFNIDAAWQEEQAKYE
ncbi:hypothetical protein [Francisella philomiragia]|uniref:hypothetical protein n=1 Tax=Francisella philomiragia TaxID=28110 RepID=UPI0022442386|nr:hypothetical protein [Francisella philomiragia]